MTNLTAQQEQVVNELRQAGWAVCLIGPDQLEGVDSDRLESRLRDDAKDHIDDLSEHAA